MLKTTFKFGFMVILLFFGILMGMNIAEKGLLQVAGNPDSNLQSFQVTQQSNQLEVKVMGKTFSSALTKENVNEGKSPSNSKERGEPNKASDSQLSFLNRLGNKLGSIVQSGAEKGLHFIANLME